MTTRTLQVQPAVPANRKKCMQWWHLCLKSMSRFPKSYLRAVLGHRLQMMAASCFTHFAGPRGLLHAHAWATRVAFVLISEMCQNEHKNTCHVANRSLHVANLLKQAPGSLVNLEVGKILRR